MFAIGYKRLEEGTFRFPRADQAALEVEAGELTGAKRQKAVRARGTVDVRADYSRAGRISQTPARSGTLT